MQHLVVGKLRLNWELRVWEVCVTRGHKWCHHSKPQQGEWRRFECWLHKIPTHRLTTLEPLLCGVVYIYELKTVTNETITVDQVLVYICWVQLGVHRLFLTCRVIYRPWKKQAMPHCHCEHILSQLVLVLCFVVLFVVHWRKIKISY